MGVSLALSSGIMNGKGFGGSFGFVLVVLGYVAFAFVCWLGYTNNKIVKYVWFVPAALIFIGSLINWIAMKYFSVCIKNVTVFFLFDFLGTIVLIGGTVLLGMYLVMKLGEKPAQRKAPVYAQQPQQPQQPYQGQ